MKEAKNIVLVLIIVLIILIPFIFYYYNISELVYNILISVVTGIVVSVLTALIQYFVIRSQIKNNIFSCYFDMYKAIYVSIKSKRFYGYPVMNVYKELLRFNDELSKNLSEFSGFVPNKYNKLYKKLNPIIILNKKFNSRNIVKLVLPFNSKRFNDIVIPLYDFIENILKNIDSKRFEKEFEIYEKMFCILCK